MLDDDFPSSPIPALPPHHSHGSRSAVPNRFTLSACTRRRMRTVRVSALCSPLPTTGRN